MMEFVAMEKPCAGIIGDKFNIISFAGVNWLGVARELGSFGHRITVNCHNFELMTVQMHRVNS